MGENLTILKTSFSASLSLLLGKGAGVVLFVRAVVLAICVVVVFPLSSAVGQSDDITACVAMENADERLACFDAAAAPSSSDDSKSSLSDRPQSQWQYVETQGNLGETIARAVNTSVQIESEYTNEAELNIRCLDGKLEGYIVWFTNLTGNDSLGEAPRLAHRVRVDEEPVFVTQNWGTSSTRTATFFTQHSSNILEQIIGAKRFAVQVHPTNKHAIAATFDVEFGEEPISKVLTACDVDISKFGKQGIFGLVAQPVSGSSSASTSAFPKSTAQRSYTPTSAWLYDRSGADASAYVLSQSKNTALVLTCTQTRPGVALELQSPEGWIANESLEMLVDDRVFNAKIFGANTYVTISDDPNGKMFVTEDFIAALQSGAFIEFVGSSTTNMPDGARIYSLRGSSAAIRSMRRHCGS